MNRIRYMCRLIGGDAFVGLIRQLKIRLVSLCYKVKKRAAKTQNCYITCTGKTDGIGAQVQAVFSTILFAQEFGITYAHTPFDKIWSDYPSKEWEDFFNLGKDEININEIDKNSLSVVYVNHPFFINFKSDTLYIVEHCHSFVDSGNNSRLYSDIIDRLVEKYQNSSKKNCKSSYKVGKINIAVHVRRGDVSKTGIHSERYTDNLYYRYLLNNIRSTLSSLKINASIHLYSQGKIEDFHELKELDINYHLDECVFTTFNNLVSSDVIIMSKSTYSYSAALLSKAIIIYEPFWHKPLEGWIVASWNNKNKKAALNELHLKQRLKTFKLNE